MLVEQPKEYHFIFLNQHSYRVVNTCFYSTFKRLYDSLPRLLQRKISNCFCMVFRRRVEKGERFTAITSPY